MKKLSVRLIALGLISLAIGCATVPKVRHWQPWTRTLNSETELETNKSITLEIAGQTDPLLGDEALTANKIAESVSNLLERRGFRITNENPDYKLKLLYKTIRDDKVSSFSSFSSKTSTIAGTKSGLGVRLAQAIGLAATSNSVSTTQSTFESEMYNHTISVEIYNTNQHLLWKGESTWDTGNLDLTYDIFPALQTLFSYLPADRSTLPRVKAIKPTHVTNYYNIVCRNRKFSCPTLRYRLSLDKFQRSGISVSIKEKYALAAYVDLMQTAEYALPIGSKNWDDPLKSFLWSKVKLGGQYLLGPEQNRINVIMAFSGEKDSYYIDKCQVVSDAEYSEFRIEMDRWQQTLVDYYDVYEQ